MTMTLEQVRDKLRRYAKDADTYFNRTGDTLELTSADLLADAIDAHITQPAQSVDVKVVASELYDWMLSVMPSGNLLNAAVACDFTGAILFKRALANKLTAALQEKGNAN